MIDEGASTQGHGEVERPHGSLPEAVRQRVVSLAAECLGDVPASQLPASLKRVATFASARRARLAGNQIAAVLETDAEFRKRLAVQVRARMPELAAALDGGTPPPAADPAELAAVAYLMQAADWEEMAARAADAAVTTHARSVEVEAAAQRERLRHQLEDLQRRAREERERSRQQVAAVKAENTELRHKLGEARGRARSADRLAADVQSEADRAAETAKTAADATDAELRRLRTRVEELEGEVAAVRRAGRAVKDQGTLRARLLLDTVLEATQGLRRELALPTVEGAPADTVEADLAEHGSRLSSGHGSLSPEDPSLLDQLLGLPGAHLVVDGYNVTKNAWPESSLEIQRDRLLGGLAPLSARTGAEVTVVFDAADKVERPLVKRPRGVRVLYSPFGVIADDVIRDLVAAEPEGRPLVVVSSDQAVVRDVRRAGARTAAAAALSRLLARG